MESFRPGSPAHRRDPANEKPTTGLAAAPHAARLGAVQTRLVAAASGVVVALGFSFLALRSSGAHPGAAGSHPGIAPLTASPTTRSSASVPASARTTRPTTTRPPERSLEEQSDAAIRPHRGEQGTATLRDTLALWSATDAGAALVWLEQHPEQDQATLLDAIGEGLAANPAGTTFALAYLAQDHERGALLAGSLVRTLAQTGNARGAARLARATPEGWAHEWATVAFTTLGYEDVATALEALATVSDPALRRTTAAAIIAGWSERDPAGLAQYAEHSGALMAAPAR